MRPRYIGFVGLVAIGLGSCGGDGPAAPPLLPPDEPAAPPPPPSQPAAQPAAIEMISGDGQEGKAGAFLAPFVVRVTDARGEGIEGVEVRWRVESGRGDIAGGSDLSTDADGLAKVSFEPHVLGTSTVSAHAAVPGLVLEGSPVTFTAEATVLLIYILEGGIFCVPTNSNWHGPCWGTFLDAVATFFGHASATVPVGTPVEWVNWGTSPVTLKSVSAAPGGPSLDSGPLNPGESFPFVPGVAGTWEFVEQVSGWTGSLTAQ
jgi:hypothetical protein